MRITAASTSVRAFEQPLRVAAAVARTMLVGAAADRWNAEPKECETADSFVINRGRSFTFGELAEEAADRAPPGKPQLRQETQGRLIGNPLPRLDGPAKADGSWRFAADVRLPDMLYASVRVAPPGGKLLAFSRDEIARVHGIRHVAARDGWIAVVAETWWAAERGAQAANAKFSGTRSPSEFRSAFEDALAHGDDRREFRRGDYQEVIRGSRPLAATYFVAPSQHFGLEPVTATAQIDGRHIEVWAPTQAPGLARAAAATAGHINALNVTLYPMPVGEPAGRAVECDAIPYAVELARNLKRPVQATLSHTTGQNQDLMSAGALARMTALPGQGGITAAWKMQVCTVDGMTAAIQRMLGVEDKRRLIRAAINGHAALRDSERHDRGSAPFPALSRRLHARIALERIRLLRRELRRRAGARRGHGAAGLPHVDAWAERTARALPAGGSAARGMGRRRTREHDGHRRLLGLRVAHRARCDASIGDDQRVQGRPAVRGGRLRRVMNAGW